MSSKVMELAMTLFAPKPSWVYIMGNKEDHIFSKTQLALKENIWDQGVMVFGKITVGASHPTSLESTNCRLN